MTFNKNLKKCMLLATFIMLSVLCILNVNSQPFFDWDESRHIVSALQMIDSGNYVVNWFGANPDMWNLKPPVSFWSIVFFSNLFGNSLITMRMASIVASLLLVLICSCVALKRYGYASAVAFILLVISCREIFISHGFRTADADAVYLLFSIASVIVLSAGFGVRNISLAAFLISIAFLTKSWHALSFGFPFIAAYYYMFRNESFDIKSILIPAACFFLPIILWLSIRYQYDGFEFFRGMVSYDLLHRSTLQIEGHYSSRWFYLQNLIDNYLLVIIVFITSLIASLFLNGFKKTFRYDIVILLTSVLTLISLFSLAETRLAWYGYPHIILLCFTSAILLSRIGVVRIPLMCILIIMSMVSAVKTMHVLSDLSIPDYYNQLLIIKKKDNLNIHVPQDISQSERAAIMVLGGFSQDRIQSNDNGSEYYLMYRNNSNNTQSLEGCKVSSESADISIYKCKK